MGTNGSPAGVGARARRSALAARAGAIAVAGAILAACAGPGAPPSDAEATRIRVVPFTVSPQDADSTWVGRAAAGSLASRLADFDGVLRADVGDRPGDRENAALVIEGQLALDQGGATARVRIAGSPELTSETVIEVVEPGGDLALLASALAEKVADRVGLRPSSRHVYVADLAGGPEVDGLEVRRAAHASVRNDDPSETVAMTRHLVERYPDDADARVVLAWSVLRAWDAHPASADLLEELRAEIAAIDRIDADNPHDELLRAYVYRSSGQPDTARVLYDDVLARDDLARTLRSWALRQRAYASLQVGEAEAALADAERAARLDPAHAMSLVAASKALETLDRIDEAVVRSRQALALQPGSWRHLQRLALLLARAERYDEAVDAFERSCRASAAQEVCANLAVTLQRSGRPEDARAAAEHAARLPGTRWGLYNLACYAALRGDHEAALAHLRGAVDLGYADVLIRTDPDLASLRDDPALGAIVAEVDERISTRRQLSMAAFPWQA